MNNCVLIQRFNILEGEKSVIFLTPSKSNILRVRTPVVGNGYENLELQLSSIYNIIKEIQYSYYHYFNISFSAFISSTCNDLSVICDLYTQALEYSLYRIRFGHSCILSYKDLNLETMGRFNISDNSISDLLEALKSTKSDDMNKSITSIIEQLSSCNYNNIMFALSYVTSSIFNILSIIEQNSTVKFDFDFMSFHEKITKLETLDEIHKGFIDLFEYIILKVNSNKDNRYNVIVDRTIAFIQDHYADKNLSLNLVADMLKISPVTLGKIFRENYWNCHY